MDAIIMLQGDSGNRTNILTAIFTPSVDRVYLTYIESHHGIERSRICRGRGGRIEDHDGSGGNDPRPREHCRSVAIREKCRRYGDAQQKKLRQSVQALQRTRVDVGIVCSGIF